MLKLIGMSDQLDSLKLEPDIKAYTSRLHRLLNLNLPEVNTSSGTQILYLDINLYRPFSP